MGSMVRGSEWNRWDLHVHTPFSVFNNGFDNNFDEYVKKLFLTALENNIVAIGLTDYTSIAGYKKVVNEYINDESKLKELFINDDTIKKIKDILLLPNIEFRLNKLILGNSINFHVILSNKIAVEDIEQNFLENLNFVFQTNPYGNPETRSLKERNIIEYGEKLKSEQSSFTGDAYKVGLQQIVVDEADIMEVLNNNSTFKNNFLICIPVDEDLSNISWNGHDHSTRKKFIQMCNCFFTSNQNTINWGLGNKSNSCKEYIDEFKSLKPSIHGCDAHNFDSLFKPDLNRYCWIKAMPTFYGLKQILYEPKDRVRIQEAKPEEKQSYYIIDNVEISDNNFSSERIYFNDKLNCIIGGKSTGKSLLLHNIARAIDKEQVIKKSQLTNSNIKPVIGIKVYWKDGYISESSNIKKDRKIIYIPQTYLNRLSDEKEENTEIDKIILEILLQDKKINEKYKNMLEEIHKIKEDTDKRIYDLVNTLSKINEIESTISELGGKEGVNNECNKLIKERDSLLKETNITNEEISLFEETQKKIIEINNEIEKIISDKEILLNIKSLEINTDFINYLSSPFKKPIIIKIEAIEKEFEAQWNKTKTEILNQLDLLRVEKESIRIKEREIESQLKPKIEQSISLKKINENLLKEQAKLKQILDLEEKAEHLKESEKRLFNHILNSRKLFYNCYSEFANSVNNIRNNSNPDDNLKFNLEVVFRKEFFIESILKEIDKRTIPRFKEANLNAFTNNDYNNKFLTSFYFSAKQNDSSSIELKSSINLEGMLRLIFSDWYNIDYVVKVDNDTIYEMSPGKKALVLLKLLIDLAESKCPILIDQPEDDLDNRSIFDELIIYLKERKKDRQIIVVTHNANIVLGGDSEQVIVANQDGRNSPNSKYRFEYKFGAIENEDKKEGTDDGSPIGILDRMSIQEHICAVLEGGEQAFDLRKNKYFFQNIK